MLDRRNYASEKECSAAMHQDHHDWGRQRRFHACCESKSSSSSRGMAWHGAAVNAVRSALRLIQQQWHSSQRNGRKAGQPSVNRPRIPVLDWLDGSHCPRTQRAPKLCTFCSLSQLQTQPAPSHLFSHKPTRHLLLSQRDETAEATRQSVEISAAPCCSIRLLFLCLVPAALDRLPIPRPWNAPADF